MPGPVSYAQVASKVPALNQAPSSNISAEPKDSIEISTQSGETNATVATSSTAVSKQSTEAAEGIVTFSVATSDMSNEKPAASSNPVEKENVTEPLTDEQTRIVKPMSDSAGEDPGNVASNPTGHGVRAAENRRNRKAKKSRENTKDGENSEVSESKDIPETKDMVEKPAAPVKLMPAPVPQVNPWHNKRPSVATSSVAAVVGMSAPVSVNETTEGPIAKTIVGSSSNPLPVKAQNKPTNEPQLGSQQRRPTIHSRSGERENVQASPAVRLVNDPTSWPTLAADDLKASVAQQSSQQIKPERIESIPVPGRGGKPDWKEYPITHQIHQNPQNSDRSQRAARGGNRGGRDSGSRGGAHVSNSINVQVNSSSRLSKGAQEGKVRNREGSANGALGGTRNNNNFSSGTKQTTAGDAGTRRQSIASVKDGSDNAAVSTAPSVLLGGQDGQQSAHARKANMSRRGKGGNSHRNFSQRNKTEHSGSEIPGAHSLPNGKSHGFGHSRESHNREFSQNGRDRDSGRIDRGRGGYRNRGSHGGNSHGHSHSHSHSQSFAGSNGQSYQSNIGRQGPFSPTVGNGMTTFGNSQGRNRGNRGNSYGRSGSTSQSSGINGNYRGPHIATDIPNFGYHGVPHSAPPYSGPAMQHISLEDLPVEPGPTEIIRQQIEFYFSEQNLATDKYLRRHMDSSGFVHLQVIAKFNRVTQLAQSTDEIRNAVSLSSILELCGAGDGIERIRLRQGSEKYIFPLEQRANEGKTDRNDYFPIFSSGPFMNQMYGNPYQYSIMQPPYYGAPHANGMDTGHFHGPDLQGSHMHRVYKPSFPSSGLTAEAPEFMPSQSNGIVNGGNGKWSYEASSISPQMPNGTSNTSAPPSATENTTSGEAQH